MPCSPMKWQRCVTSTPGQSDSTMKAVILLSGVRAITTMTSAMVPLVHHSFSPLIRYASPSSVSVAVVCIRAGSLPTSGSVSAKALISPATNRGKYFCFCSGVPNSLSGCGTPMDWCADSSTPTEPS